MKILYILGALMMIGILLVAISTAKVLDEMNDTRVKTRYRFQRSHRKKTQTAPVKTTEMQAYMIAGYIGMTFFFVGAVGSVIVLVQSFNRRF